MCVLCAFTIHTCAVLGLQGEGASGGNAGKEKKPKPSNHDGPNGSTPTAAGGEGESQGSATAAAAPFGRVDSSSLTLEATASTLNVRKDEGQKMICS